MEISDIKKILFSEYQCTNSSYLNNSDPSVEIFVIKHGKLFDFLNFVYKYYYNKSSEIFFCCVVNDSFLQFYPQSGGELFLGYDVYQKIFEFSNLKDMIDYARLCFLKRKILETK